MAAMEVQVSLSQSDHSTLDNILRPHLQLEPRTIEEEEEEERGDDGAILSPGDPSSSLFLLRSAYWSGKKSRVLCDFTRVFQGFLVI